MRILVTGIGGVYCQLCNVSKEVTSCHVLTQRILEIQVQNMYNINRTVAETIAIYQRVQLREIVMTSTGVYNTRAGVTHKSLTTVDSILSVSPHTLYNADI